MTTAKNYKTVIQTGNISLSTHTRLHIDLIGTSNRLFR